MILKQQEYDGFNHIVTSWTPNISYAELVWDDSFKSDVLRVFKAKEQTEPSCIILDRNCGVYLCNDEGKTIEVLHRIQVPN